MEKRFENGNDRLISYRVYKDEFDPRYIGWLKSAKNNYWLSIAAEAKTTLTVETWESNVPVIQGAMFKSASWLANEIWEN